MSNCRERERLFADHRRLLDEYSEKVAALARVIGFKEAELRLAWLYSECMAARRAIHEHDRTHGCTVENPLLSRQVG
jgi:hypothetical protein